MDGLDDKSSEGQIIDQIAKPMNLDEDARKGLEELKAAIAAECSKTPVLLLIDNYETIDKNGFSVIKALTDIKCLKMMVTSRGPVGIPYLGLLLNKMGNKGKAEEHYEEAYRITLTLSVKDNAYKPDFAKTIKNYAILLANMSDRVSLDKAKELYDKALEIYRPLSNEYPAAYLPKVADVCQNYAILLQKMGDDKEASELSKEAEAIRKKLSELSP